MLRYLGYVAIALSIGAITNRTCRLRNASPERLRSLIKLNLQDLYRVLQFNVEHSIFLYRISSQIIPFASHPINQILWWDEYADLFTELAFFIGRHRLRISMHPGQFTVLNSPQPEVVAESVRELEWHVRLLDCLRTDPMHKIVVHGGGTYGDKAAAADRFAGVVNLLPESWRHRLVLENDDHNFTVEDVLDLSRRTGLPVVFDWLHHKVNPGPGDELWRVIDRCFATWHRPDGIPKVHFSTQANDGRRGQHADWINVDELEEFLSLTPQCSFDCMLEAKRKDLALFRLRDELEARGIGKGASA